MAGLTIAVALIAAAAAYAQDPPRTAFRLASDAGCLICHDVEAPERGTHHTIPKAPAFQDIACRYRSEADAASRLSSIVRDGSGPLRRDRHWTGKVAFDTMYPHDLSVTEAQSASPRNSSARSTNALRPSLNLQPHAVVTRIAGFDGMTRRSFVAGHCDHPFSQTSVGCT